MPAAEPALWGALTERGCPRAREALILRYQPLVGKSIERLLPRVPVRIDREDLVSEGLLALVRAVDRFDPARGIKFSSFAISCIRGAILEWLRHEDWAPRSVRDRIKRGEAVPVMELVSLDGLLRDGDGERTFGPLRELDTLADPGAGPEALAVAGAERDAVCQLVGALPANERHAVREYFWGGRTWRQIAGGLDRSESRLHQIYMQAAMRLRKGLEAREREMSEDDTAQEAGFQSRGPALAGGGLETK